MSVMHPECRRLLVTYGYDEALSEGEYQIVDKYLLLHLYLQINRTIHIIFHLL